MKCECGAKRHKTIKRKVKKKFYWIQVCLRCGNEFDIDEVEDKK